MLTETRGNLFEYVGQNPEKILVIPHVVNNKDAFGAGFVVPLMHLYPEAKKRYHTDKYYQNLGFVQYIPCTNHGDLDAKKRNVLITNMCAQTLGGERPLFYNSLSRCMDNVARVVDGLITVDKTSTVEIVCPRFGSALAGGNWEFIKELIHDCWVRNGLTVKVFYL